MQPQEEHIILIFFVRFGFYYIFLKTLASDTREGTHTSTPPRGRPAFTATFMPQEENVQFFSFLKGVNEEEGKVEDSG